MTHTEGPAKGLVHIGPRAADAPTDPAQSRQPAVPDQLAGLIGCPKCDALYRVNGPYIGKTVRCDRCHHVLIAPRRKAGMTIIMLALTVVVLVGGALWFPFLTIERAGFANRASLVDAARAFSTGWMVLLSFSVLAFIVIIPLARALLLIYVLVPLVFDRPAALRAAAAFRLSEYLRPWSMAEIFALGCAVSLVKIADLARVGFGPAFWMFGAVVLVTIMVDTKLCRWSVWDAIGAGHPARRGNGSLPPQRHRGDSPVPDGEPGA